MKLRLLILWCCFVCGVAGAQEETPQKLLPGPGEIALEGKITSVEAGKLTLAAMNEGTNEASTNFEAAEKEGWTRYELRKVQPQKKTAHSPETK